MLLRLAEHFRLIEYRIDRIADLSATASVLWNIWIDCVASSENIGRSNCRIG